MNYTELFNQWYADAVGFMPRLLVIMIAVLISVVVSRRAQMFVRSLSGRTKAPPEIGVLLGRMARLGVLLIGLLVILQQLNWIQVALGFVTGLGIAGIVIGFALQDIVKQFAAGVLLLMLRPFRVGDYIKVTSFEGTVAEIQFRATVLRTVEGDEVMIPNADVYNNAVINKSRYEVRRRTLTFQIPRDTDVEQARAALLRAIAAVPGVAANPQPVVVGTSMDDTKTSLEARFWVDSHATDPDSAMTRVIVATRHALEQPAET